MIMMRTMDVCGIRMEIAIYLHDAPLTSSVVLPTRPFIGVAI